jgi:PAS domain S-box-containing protein
MSWHPPAYVVALVVVSLAAVGLAGVGYRNRDVNGGVAFTVMMLSVALWAYGDAAKLLAEGWRGYVWWTNISFATSVVVPTAGFVFVLAYTGNAHRITRRTLGLLAVEPTLSVLLAWTTRGHGLMWEYTGELQTSPVTWAPVENGVVYQLHLAYTYVLIAALFGLLVRFYLRSRGAYRWQTLLLLVGALVPTVTNVGWLLVQHTYPESVDPTPLTFVITGVLFTAGLRSFDLLELSPVGRHTIVEELHDAVLTVDESDRIVDANPVARELLADDDATLVGEAADDVVPAYEGLLEGAGEADDVTVTVDGERRYLDIRESPLTDAGGTVVGRVVLLRDVTERRRVEKRYQLLIENSTDLINVLDDDGTIKYVSPSVRSVLGYEQDNVVGTNAFGYIHPDDRERVLEQFGALSEEPGDELRADYRMRTIDGGFREMESRGRNLLDDPVIEGIVVNSRDVTERRERERELERQNEQLEEFASVISHDLRGPLSVAHGYARLVEDELDDERIGKVVAAHERMEELIEDLLTLAREGRAVSEPQPVDLAEASRRAWAIVDTSDAEVEVTVDRTLLADDTRLRQLLENLFSNAAQHGEESTDARAATADGGSEPAVTVTVGATETGFYVADDGPGIPAEQRERVLEAGETSDEEGIGLGLTIVRRIAEAHGWTVSVGESADGGAKFTFEGVEWVE